MNEHLRGLLPPDLEALVAKLSPERQDVATILLACGYAHGVAETVDHAFPLIRDARTALLERNERVKTLLAALTPYLAEAMS